MPPGPRWGALSTFRFMRNPSGVTARWRRRFGDTFTIPATNGRIVATVSPEFARKIFSLRSDAVAAYAEEAFVPALGPYSLFAMSGRAHQEERRLLLPPFHARRMLSYTSMMERVAERTSADWPGAGTLVLMDALNDISSEIIVRCVFGVTDESSVARAGEVVREFVASFHPAALFFPALQSRLVPGWGRFIRARTRLREMLAHEIDARRRESGADQEAGADLEAGADDILSMLLGARYEDGRTMTREALVDELSTLLVAGHETTTVAMTWALYWLSRHREARERLLDELAQSHEPGPWMEACCKETLRLHPVASDVVRTLTEPLELGPWTIPSGCAVGVVITGIHEREDLFPAPHRFEPGRFLERSYGPHEYMPFGGGVRRCLGAAFAAHEMKVVLATLLRRYSFEPTEPSPVLPVRRNVVMAPRGGIPVVVKERSAP